MWTYGEEKTIYVAINIDKPVVALSTLIMVFLESSSRYSIGKMTNGSGKKQKRIIYENHIYYIYIYILM